MEKKRFMIGVDCEGVACAVGQCGKAIGDGDNYRFAAKRRQKPSLTWVRKT